MNNRININGINFKIESMPSIEIQHKSNEIMNKLIINYGYSRIVDVIYKPEISNLPENKEIFNIINNLIKEAGIEFVSLFLISFKHKKKPSYSLNDTSIQNKTKVNEIVFPKNK